MALAPQTNSSTGATAGTGVDLPDLRIFVFILFFVFGGITSLNDILIPKLKHLFTLSFAQAMLIQSAFFAAYFFISLPAARLVQRIGYMRTAAVGLMTMTAGCLLFVPATLSTSFGAFLFALFVLAAGITTVQVVANPLISLLGPPATTHSRLTFAQAFNSLGTTIFPYFGAILILGSLASIDDASLTAEALQAYRAQESQVIANAYLGIAVALVIVAALVFLGRNRLKEQSAPPTNLLQSFDLLRQPRFAFGTLGIFVYVGAEVSIGSLLASFLMQTDTLGLAAQRAGEMVAFYWGGAMIGRFIGAGLLRRFDPALVLFAATLGAGAMLLVAGASIGTAAGIAIIAIGLFNSIMFPTIFSITMERSKASTASVSGLMCMAIVGGALLPWLSGKVADATGIIGTTFILPAIAYVIIVLYAVLGPRSRLSGEGDPTPLMAH